MRKTSVVVLVGLMAAGCAVHAQGVPRVAGVPRAAGEPPAAGVPPAAGALRVRVRVEKPGALRFARSAGVEIERKVSDFA